MLKKSKKILLAAFVCLLTINGSAEQISQIAVIDSQRAIEGSISGQKAVAQLQTKRETIKNKLSQIDNQLFSLQSRLKTQELTLSLDAKQKLLFELESLKTQRIRDEEDYTKEYQQLQFSLINKIKSEMMPIITGLAQEKGYSLVFDLSAGSIVYAHSNFDITDEVIRRYNTSQADKK
jgi:Skp family chaperone for outer membrane proteins